MQTRFSSSSRCASIRCPEVFNFFKNFRHRRDSQMMHVSAQSFLSWKMMVVLLGGCVPGFSRAAPIEDVQPYLQINTGLQQLMSEAATVYPTVAAATANLTAVGADLSAAKWARFPSLSVEGSAYRERAIGTAVTSDNKTQTTAIVDQPLWTGGVITGNIERVTFQQTSALSALGEAVLDVELQVAQHYFEVKRQSQRLAILHNSLTEHQGLVDMMRRRVEQQVSPASDLELVSSRLAQMQMQLVAATAARNASVQRLEDLVGRADLDLQFLGRAADMAPALNLEELTKLALEFNPKLQRLQAESGAASAATQVSRAQLLPKLDMQYSYNDATGSRIGLVLKSQFSGGLSGIAASEATKMRQVATELQVKATEREIRNLMVADYEEYSSYRSRFSVATGAAESAQRISESYMRQFTSGLRTWLDLMNAVRESATASLDEVDTRVGTEYALIKITLRAGLWRAELSRG